MCSQNRPQDDIILQDESAGLAPAVPVRPKLKVPLEPYDKKPRLSLMTLKAVGLPALALLPYMWA